MGGAGEEQTGGEREEGALQEQLLVEVHQTSDETEGKEGGSDGAGSEVMTTLEACRSIIQGVLGSATWMGVLIA